MQLEQEIQGTADRKFGPPVTALIEMPYKPLHRWIGSLWASSSGASGGMRVVPQELQESLFEG